MRVFLDANVLFSAAKSDGAIRQLLRNLVARAAEGVEASIGPSDDQIFDDFADEYLDIWQESGEK